MPEQREFLDEMIKWLREHKETVAQYDDNALRSVNLLENGIIDSLDLLDLIGHLEAMLSCKLDLGGFEDEDLLSADTISARAGDQAKA
tara:strand:- start:192 stop:455 length:264 start_codon:yes stop_codon:yes gene_type:complete